jgi:hypothetical protein
LDESTSCCAATNINCLKYVHENGCPWDEYTCAAAIDVNCLEYAHTNGCPWNTTTTDIFAASGEFTCLQYAHENGCPLSNEVIEFAIMNIGNNDDASFECFKYVHTYGGGVWTEVTSELAARNGKLNCLKYLHENGCPWDESTCRYAAYNGHLECLKYALEHGCPWDDETLYANEHKFPECPDDIFISNADLENPENTNKYSIEMLEHNIEHLNHSLIVRTQKITAKFYIKHIYICDFDDDDSEDAYKYSMEYFLEHQNSSKEEFIAVYEMLYGKTLM